MPTRSPASSAAITRATRWQRLRRAGWGVRLVGLVLLLAAGEILTADPLMVRTLREIVLDAYQRVMPREPQRTLVQVVEIDDAAIAEVGQWPWPRGEIARLTESVLESGALVVGYDIVFSEPDRLSPAYCRALAGEEAGPALSALFNQPTAEQVMAEAIRGRPVVVGLAPLTQRPDQAPVLEPAPLHNVIIRRLNDGPDNAAPAYEDWQVMLRLPAMLHNLPELEQAAAGWGAFQGGSAEEGVTRRLPLMTVVRQAGPMPDEQARWHRYPSLSLEVLRVALKGPSTYFLELSSRPEIGVRAVGVSNALGHSAPLSLLPASRRHPLWQTGQGEPMALYEATAQAPPTHLLLEGRTGQMLAATRLRPAAPGQAPVVSLFPQPAQAGEAPSFHLRPYAGPADRHLVIPTDYDGHVWPHFAPLDAGRYVSAADVLAGRHDRGRLAGKIVLIGASAEALRDVRSTALGEVVPGVEIHAQLIESIIEGSLLVRTAVVRGHERLALYVGGALLILLVPAFSLRRNLLLLLGLGLVLAGIGWALFAGQRVLFDYGSPLVLLTLLFLVLFAVNYVRDDGQRRYIRTAFGHYLAPELVEMLAERPELLRIGGESREVSVLFTDIAGFTRFTERTSPQTAIDLLQRYMDQMIDIVMRHGGTVDKMIGDAIVALFNAPLDQPDHRQRALACARDLEAAGARLSRQWTAQGHAFGITRIGVHSGRALVGNFGGAGRFTYTAYGDTVNVAARLETANKHLGTRLCVSNAIAEAVDDDQPLRPIGEVVVAGRAKAIQAWQPMTPGPQTDALLACYLPLYEAMAAGEKGIEDQLLAAAEAFPDDPVIEMHRRRFAAGGRGVRIILTDK